VIICEMATNWHDIAEAKRMIEVAYDYGAGLAKFQLFNAEDDKGKPHYDWVKAHELTFYQAKELFDFGASIGMEVFFSVFGVQYVDWCERIGVKRYKLACNLADTDAGQDAMVRVVKTKKPRIVSLTIGDYWENLKTLREGEKLFGWNSAHRRVSLLFCVPQYPATIKFMPDFEMSSLLAGFSDHTIGIDAAKIAIARGASIIEKHFVLNHDTAYPDNDWSMDPTDLRELVRWEGVVKSCL
jgi:sialic acid synthase SpsE